MGSSGINTAVSHTGHTHVFYHKLHRFFMQAQDVPLEFAVQVSGVKAIVIDTLRTLSVSSPSIIHADLLKIIRQLEITPQAEEALETFFWVRSNDVQIAFAAPVLNAEFIVAKLKEILMVNPKTWVEKAKANICGQTPFNINYAFEYLPYKAIVPSEMGFPLFIETQATGLIHARGDLALNCNGHVPSLEANIVKKVAYSYSGYVGHLCPFTNQLMAAGVDTHRAINLPMRAAMKLELTTGTLKVEAKQLATVTPQMTAVDIHHFHVKPFTTMKPSLFIDLVPIVLSANTRFIQTQSPRKTIEVSLGERLGLDIKFKAVTECEVYDKTTIRFHMYTVVHNPTVSTTKALEFEVKLAAATKIRNSPLIKHIAANSPMKLEHEEMLDNSIAKIIGAENILATNAVVIVKLLGGAPKTFEFTKTMAVGLKDMELKGNFQLVEKLMTPRMVCIFGAMKVPTEIQAIRKFKFQNKIGFGSTCEQHEITMNGFTVTSQRQIEFSRRSEAARECPRISREASELDMHIRSLPEGCERAKMVRSYGQLVLKRDSMCGLKKRQETALDQIEIEVTATPNLPVEVYTVGRYLDSILKGLLVEYINQLPNFRIRDMHGVKVVIEFDQRLEALNLKITSPMDTTVYRNIRLPFWLRQIFPLHHSMNLDEQVYRALFGERLYSKCVLDRGHVHTFDKRTYNYQLDDCYHLVAADCTKRNTHAVLAKEKDNVKHVMIFIENHKIVIEEPALRYTRPTTAFTIKMQTGQERMVVVEVMPDQVVRLLGDLITVRWSHGIVTVNTRSHRVIYNGRPMHLLHKEIIAAGDHCGLCGDQNRMRQADIKSSSQCVHTSLRSMAHSFRVNSAIEQCAPLPSAAIEKLSRERAMCSRPSISYIPASISYFTPPTEAPILQHVVTYRSGQVCFSKTMLPECPIGFMTLDILAKEADFVCLPATAAETKDILRRVHLGQECRELTSMSTTFSSGVYVAKECRRQ